MANSQAYYYSNPAFCQQSEYYPPKTTSPTRKNLRQSPVGAQENLRVIEQNGYEEQEFYEEMLVDDSGVIKEKKVVVVSQNSVGKKYKQVPQCETVSVCTTRPVTLQDTGTLKKSKHRYEYIPMQEQRSFVKQENRSDCNGSRYAVIDVEESEETTGKYALVPIEDLDRKTLLYNPQQSPTNHRYEYIEESPRKEAQGGRYEYIIEKSPSSRTFPAPQQHRYEYLDHRVPQSSGNHYEYIQQNAPQHPSSLSQQYQRPPNPAATQKLHELLSTPKKTQTIGSRQQTPNKALSPHTQRRVTSPALSPIPKDPFVTTPSKTPVKKPRPPVSRAQQKLNYSLASRQLSPDKRYTAIVAPMCSSPVQSVYSEAAYSTSKTESWMNLSVMKKTPIQATLVVAATFLVLCGSVTSGLGFYMIYLMGKLYFLEFGIVSGFVCLFLGFLGFGSRHCERLPNRNYISGYIVLSVFSLLTCAGLLVLLFIQPRPGSPLADMTSGAVCGISVLSLVLASTGVVSSYCCKHPPPDNRVQHCAQGFVV